MDPNANLREQRELVEQINTLLNAAHGKRLTGTQEQDIILHSARLAELVEALDQWIAGGGFLPDSWEIAHKRAAPPPQCAERTGGGHQCELSAGHDGMHHSGVVRWW